MKIGMITSGTIIATIAIEVIIRNSDKDSSNIQGKNNST